MPRYVDMSGWDSFMNDMLDSRNKYDTYDNGYTDAMDRVDYWLEAQPTIDPESMRPKAVWTLNKDGSATCGNCRRTQMNAWDYDSYDRYCSSCGAKMRLKGEKDDG